VISVCNVNRHVDVAGKWHKKFLHFHGNNDYANALQGYIMRTLPVSACSFLTVGGKITWLTTNILIFWDVTHFAAFSNVPTNSGADKSSPNHWGRKHNVCSKRRYLAQLLSLLVDCVRVVVNCPASRLYSWGRNSLSERLCGLHNWSGHSEEQKGSVLVPGIKLGFVGPSVPRCIIICLKDNGSQKKLQPRLKSSISSKDITLLSFNVQTAL
jgi:hypothetical protein